VKFEFKLELEFEFKHKLEFEFVQLGAKLTKLTCGPKLCEPDMWVHAD
jgi:hypothetical protein